MSLIIYWIVCSLTFILILYLCREWIGEEFFSGFDDSGPPIFYMISGLFFILSWFIIPIIILGLFVCLIGYLIRKVIGL